MSNIEEYRNILGKPFKLGMADYIPVILTKDHVFIVSKSQKIKKIKWSTFSKKKKSPTDKTLLIWNEKLRQEISLLLEEIKKNKKTPINRTPFKRTPVKRTPIKFL